MKYKAVIWDLDGTLLQTDKTISDKTIAQDDILLVVLDGTAEDYNPLEEIPNIAEVNQQAEIKTTQNGYKYKNPYKGEASIVYDPNTNNYEDIKMDLLHALRVQDPKYRELVEELDNIALGENGDISSNAR